MAGLARDLAAAQSEEGRGSGPTPHRREAVKQDVAPGRTRGGGEKATAVTPRPLDGRDVRATAGEDRGGWCGDSPRAPRSVGFRRGRQRDRAELGRVAGSAGGHATG